MIWLFIISDIFSLCLGLLLSYSLRDKGFFRLFLDSVQPLEVYLFALPFAALLLIFIFFIKGLYEIRKPLTTFSEIYLMISSITYWVLLIMAGSYLSKFDYSRIIVLLTYLFSLIFIILGRLLIRLILSRMFKKGYGRINVLIIGAGKPAKEIAQRLNKYKTRGLHLIGFVSDDKLVKNDLVLGSLKNLNQIIKKYLIQEIFIADPSLSYKDILNLIACCPYKDTKFKVTSNIFDLITGKVDIANLEGIPSLDLSRVQSSIWIRIYKMILDFLLALIGLILTSPFWLLIILLIKLETKGPAIFTQLRIGFKGRPFKIYKFRTMESGKVTKIGEFLRKTSLDELPQLINILAGEMSIVGPRPEIPSIVKRYELWQRRRLEVKPGLTGLWQILGRKDLPLIKNIEYDFYYINNRSLILDLIIILKTIPLIISGKGAY